MNDLKTPLKTPLGPLFGTNGKIAVATGRATTRRLAHAHGLGLRYCDLDLPDFEGSLDAMAQARAILDDAQRRRYVKHLIDIIASSWAWGGINATAAQHAEAFCRTMNL